MKKFVILILVLAFIGSVNIAKDFDHSLFDNILKENVDEKGMINYEKIAKDKNFDKYINSIANADTKDLNDDEKLAFYINAYNAYTIRNVLNNWPIDSPLHVKGFFKEFKFTVAGKELSLDEIEHKHVLPIDPIVPHFGLVCAALSCPKLIQEAYTGENVYRLLEENGRIFFEDSFKNRLDRENNILYLSHIFKWFGRAFKDKHGDLVSATKIYMNENDQKFLNETEVDIKFVKYDWTLNKQ